MDDLTISVNSIIMSDDSCLNKTLSNIASNIHPRLDIYKKKTNYSSNQEERRRSILIAQKRKREALQESNRQIESHVKNGSVKKSPTQPSKQPKKSLINPQYTNQLMFSEWLEEVPFDLNTNWIMTLCPVGKRCLVVASEGTTCIYNKAGKLITKHFSKLPGGSKDSKIDYTILDCIYDDVLRTYFILDCICWKSHPIVDSETEFRFYWLKCKLDESPEITKASHENPYPFRDLPRINNLSVASIQNQFEQTYDFKIDGVLFYHKETHYTPGHTPLVGWLKPYMIPEILDISMPEWIIKSAPSDYINAKNSIEKFEIEQKIKYKNTNSSFFEDRVETNVLNLNLNKVNEIEMDLNGIKENLNKQFDYSSEMINLKENSTKQEI